MNYRCRNCDLNFARWRGCRIRCYQHFHNQVRSGATSWAELERLGKVNAPKPKKRLWEKRA